MKPMNLEHVVRNIDRRLERVEQILPTLPTREEFDRKLDEKIATLVTKEELDRKLDEKIANLATKDELAALGGKISEEAERSRRHTQVLFESLKDEVRLVAEGLAPTQAEVIQIIRPTLANHGQRITALEDARGQAGGSRSGR
jgi:hypothetical protein